MLVPDDLHEATDPGVYALLDGLLRLPPPRLLLHDDAEREFAYTAGAERALEAAGAEGWTVVSVKRDWATVF